MKCSFCGAIYNKFATPGDYGHICRKCYDKFETDVKAGEQRTHKKYLEKLKKMTIEQRLEILEDNAKNYYILGYE